jgi:4a-hydroxytetrahydrobiopterin dehydratase
MQDTINLEKLSINQVQEQLPHEWTLAEDNKSIYKEFKFKGYYKTIAFVNLLAWHAQEQKHHPDLEVSFGKVLVKLTTHDVDGISDRDLNMAKTINNI